MRERAIDHPLHIIVSRHVTISIDMPSTRCDRNDKGGVLSQSGSDIQTLEAKQAVLAGPTGPDHHSAEARIPVPDN